MQNNEILQSIYDKYDALGENPNTYLKGLLQAKPINYWDYIEVETLLSLQRPRTDYKDEVIFIIYHQITELTLKLLLHEIEQITDCEQLVEDQFLIRIKRLNRYTEMLISSFAIMRDGLDYDNYNIFRTTLTPASGFQSVQFRYIELSCTTIGNLINEEGKKRLPTNATIEDYIEHIYWKDAGLNRESGKKTLTLKQFEEKYITDLISFAKKIQGNTIVDKFRMLDNPSESLTVELKRFDLLYNIEWPLVHLNTAKFFLDSKDENKPATGGSTWKKYLHPQSQQRKFFPDLWSKEEKFQWGKPKPKD